MLPDQCRTPAVPSAKSSGVSRLDSADFTGLEKSNRKTKYSADV